MPDEEGKPSVGRAGRSLELSEKVTAKEVEKQQSPQETGGKATGSRLAPLDFLLFIFLEGRGAVGQRSEGVM